MTFDLFANGVDEVHKTFTSLTEAKAFFNNQAIDLGTLGKGALSGSPLTLKATLSVTTASSGSGFYSGPINGDPPAAAASSPAFILLSPSAFAATNTLATTTLTVGVGKEYAKPSQAIAAAPDGATILIDAGTYTDDFATIYGNNLTIRGVGGKAKIVQSSTGVIPNGKAIWTVDGNGDTIDNIEFSGAHVPDQNGAGIRAEQTGALTITHSYFHNNQDGLLGPNANTASITITNSEFAFNGAGDGYSHNVYVGNAASLTFMYNYTHDAKVGHLLKSRASKNVIEYNRITGQNGTDSYEIDLPNGGESYIIGNIIEQGANTQNPAIVTYAEEGATNAVQKLYVINNTIVNDRSAGGTFIAVSHSPFTKIMNNLFVGAGTTVSGATLGAGNVTTQNPAFVNRAGFDYHLTAASTAAINAGFDAGTANGMNLDPAKEYVQPLSSTSRSVVGPAIDAGAYEYTGPSAGSFAHAMAAMGAHGTALATPVAATLSSAPTLLAVRSHFA